MIFKFLLDMCLKNDKNVNLKFDCLLYIKWALRIISADGTHYCFSGDNFMLLIFLGGRFGSQLAQATVTKVEFEEKRETHFVDRIELSDQIKRINEVYRSAFNWTYQLNADSISQKKKRIALLTCVVSKDQAYDLRALQLYYNSKLMYAHHHKYELIIDTFDYLSNFNQSRTEVFYVSDQNKNTSHCEIINYFEHGYACIPRGSRLNSDPNYRAKAQEYNWRITWDCDNVTIAITNHWNKVLSLIYWSKYFDTVVWLDDDVVIGNVMNTPIHHWFNQMKNNGTNVTKPYLFLPYDHTEHLTFSNFAFIVNTSTASEGRGFLMRWYENRKLPGELIVYMYMDVCLLFNNKLTCVSTYFDQGVLYVTILEYARGYLIRLVNSSNVSSQKKILLQNSVRCIDSCVYCFMHDCITTCLPMALVARTIHSQYLPIIFLPMLSERPKFDVQANWGLSDDFKIEKTVNDTLLIHLRAQNDPMSTTAKIYNFYKSFMQPTIDRYLHMNNLIEKSQ
ncbi:hypothetical protein RFI_15410 [Reticulomyxa filosa]|uniref:Uncharacterized protein n=1 Tax=Reticulomyxa filosa TaxID=46433 RepID=X6N7R5_RETFI|nr:hypothetical protein RFI_15410 [Reticulomyxa filosa]|eukprot:ETO21794.1 hypothetical protein RFI_15410 [Reticulomyxa filosa]